MKGHPNFILGVGLTLTCTAPDCHFTDKHKHHLTEHIRRNHVRKHSNQVSYQCPYPDCVFKTFVNGNVRLHLIALGEEHRDHIILPGIGGGVEPAAVFPYVPTAAIAGGRVPFEDIDHDDNVTDETLSQTKRGRDGAESESVSELCCNCERTASKL